jgi:hypothetical protein
MDVDAASIGRVHRALDPLHSIVYFAPEAAEEYAAIGLRPGSMSYFASRSAPMGPVSAGVVVATFYNFNPALVARHIPRAWSLADPEAVLAARLRVADRALTRLLGAEVIGSPEVDEAAALARIATEALAPEGRPLYAAHAGLSWPEPAHLQLWHAISLLREHRGDGHVATLLAAGLSGIEAIVTHTATGRGFLEPAAKQLRGWSDEQWMATVAGLQSRGLMDADGLTPAGQQLRAQIEQQTDQLATAPWQLLGPERTTRLTELGRALTRTAVGHGAFPADVFAGGSGRV